ncbi:MAG TPA: SCO2322 family protein [Nocardioidaceae bacterium]|nr:SCO2322 family protein [Nocardioidaceae bacterium]
MLIRRIVGVLSALFLATGAATAVALPAHAEDGYQYWNYFHLEKNAWAFSKVGPGDYKPQDGAVEGFRYGTSTTTQGIEPRADLNKVNFDTVCDGTDAGTGEKRVAVVLDFGDEMGNGTPPEPRADCAVVPQDASTQQILQGVAQVRLKTGMTCALDGYPPSGCGVPVKDAKVPANEQPVAFALPHDESGKTRTSNAAVTSEPRDNTNLWTALGLGALVVLIAVAALVMSRRNKVA